MNYLAHLFFSDPHPLAWAGSLMGDFHKGSDFSGMPPELVRHLKLHRYVDGLTRTSEFFQNSRRQIDPGFRHARSVLVDVFYDHFLACYWDRFSDIPLAKFADGVYHGLDDCHELLSPGLQRQFPHMVNNNWLLSYRNPDVVQRVLERLEQRLKGRVSLASGFRQIFIHREQLESDFFLFMAETAGKVACWKQHH